MATRDEAAMHQVALPEQKIAEISVFVGDGSGFSNVPLGNDGSSASSVIMQITCLLYL
jgi:hypothetical protein